jgi:hypothetical protein
MEWRACSRLLELLDTPEDIPDMSHLIQREIVYRILRTPQAERLRADNLDDLKKIVLEVERAVKCDR